MIIESKAFAKALQTVGAFVEKRSTTPILTYIRVVSDGQSLTLQSDNLDFQAVYRLDSAGDPFDICVEFKSLLGFVKTQKGNVELTYDGERFSLNGFNFPTLPSADFPVLQTREYTCDVSLDPAIFGQVQSAISTEETRYYLNGVYFGVDGVYSGEEGKGKIALCATDGHRLKKYTTDLDFTGHGVIIPRLFSAFLAKQESGVLSVCPMGVRFVSGPLTAYAKVIDGSFPDVNRVIPTDSPIQALIPRQKLIDAIGVLKPFFQDKAQSCKLVFSKQSLEVSHTSMESGVHSLTIPCEHSEDLTIGFNGAYLLDTLKSYSVDPLPFGFSDESSPVLIKADDLITVLMPLRV